MVHTYISGFLALEGTGGGLFLLSGNDWTTASVAAIGCMTEAVSVVVEGEIFLGRRLFGPLALDLLGWVSF